MHKVILADDQPVYRAGLAALIQSDAMFHIAAQAHDTESLLTAIRNFPGALVLFAESACPHFFSHLGTALQQADSRAFLLSALSYDRDDLLRVNICGVARRHVPCLRLLAAMHMVFAGETAFIASEDDPAEQLDEAGARVIEKLSRRDRQVLGLLATGQKNKAIAHRLGTTEQVIKNTLGPIYDAAGVSDRLEMALFVLAHPKLSHGCTAAIMPLLMREAV